MLPLPTAVPRLPYPLACRCWRRDRWRVLHRVRSAIRRLPANVTLSGPGRAACCRRLRQCGRARSLHRRL